MVPRVRVLRLHTGTASTPDGFLLRYPWWEQARWNADQTRRRRKASRSTLKQSWGNQSHRCRRMGTNCRYSRVHVRLLHRWEILQLHAYPSCQGNDAALKELLDGNIDAVCIYADQGTLLKEDYLEGEVEGWDCSMWEIQDWLRLCWHWSCWILEKQNHSF